MQDLKFENLCQVIYNNPDRPPFFSSPLPYNPTFYVGIMAKDRPRIIGPLADNVSLKVYFETTYFLYLLRISSDTCALPFELSNGR